MESPMSSSQHSSPHSEASKLLEAALEQMDGIIQGAKFDMSPYGQTVNPAAAAPSRPPNYLSNGNNNSSNNSSSSSSVSECLRQLKAAIVRQGGDGGAVPSAAADPTLDADALTFLSRWLKNNDADDDRRNGNDPSSLLISAAEAERASTLQLQVDLLNDQATRQAGLIRDLEQLLAAKKELLRQTEQALERERARERPASEMSQSPPPPSDHELSHLKGRCAALEQENRELRQICGGNRTPKYLPIASPTSPSGASGRSSSARRRPMISPPAATAAEDSAASSPDDLSPTSAAKKEVGFTGQDENIPDEAAAAASSTLSRPPRGLKKILGKIKRSNSGGHLEEQRQQTQRPETPEFRRGGFRATAGGRLGWPAAAAAERQREMRRPVSEWNVDLICTWLECLGLGVYCADVQRTIGTGAQLAKMTFNDLETKLNVRHGLHRKKLFLALAARQEQTAGGGREDLEGQLDYQWVLRWLDDVGLPQYKDAFLEARVDGRVLNVLTVDDLFQLKVTNQLHHLSIRRGIQVLRRCRFDPNCLRRRALPGETMTADNVALWTNHRAMEWLKQVDLSEYAPNLRGSGVHGALMVHEGRFNDELLAALLSIPISKTLLRRHLSIHFKELVGRDVMLEKRSVEQETNYAALSPTAKAKPKQGQFTLKRKKSKSHFDYGDLVCPFATATTTAK